MKSHLLVSLVLLFGLFACKDSLTETDLPLPEGPGNPFDNIDYNEEMIPEIPVDSNSFLGLHTYIFNPSCNQPACHDGTFEPDYRTVQSTYNSLVLHPITKNYVSNPLPYRVTPGEPDQSMLWHRLTIQNPPNFERMPSSGQALPENLIQLIKTWIENGAPDLYGNLPMQTSSQPTSYGVAAFTPDLNGFRLDTIRGGVFFNPFLALADEPLDLWFLYLDVTPAGDTILGAELGYNKIRFSKNPVDFSNALEMNMTVEFFNPALIPSVFSQDAGFPLPYFHHVTITPSDLGYASGDIVFMRTYVQDSDHSTQTEIPESDSQIPLLTYFSFVVQ